jgi:hypothetical protein
MARYLGGVLTLAALLFAPAHASAAADNWMTCTFNGLANATTSYNLSADATCWGEVGNQVFAPTSGPNNARFTTSGSTFGNLCSEGWMGSESGSSTTMSMQSGLGAGALINGFGYEIHAAGGVGTMKIGGKSENPWRAAGTTLAGPYRGHGAVRLTPDPAGNCVFGGWANFLIQGHFAMADGLTAVDSLPTARELIDLLPGGIGGGVLPPGSGTPSASCTAATVPVVDTPVNGGYLKVLVQQNGTASTWVCIRAEQGGERLSGRLVIEYPAGGGGGTPSVDSSSGLCTSTSNNQAPGSHPLVGPGNAGGQHEMLDTWWGGGTEVWLCAELGTTNSRVKLAVPGLTGGAVRFEPDA